MVCDCNECACTCCVTIDDLADRCAAMEGKTKEHSDGWDGMGHKALDKDCLLCWKNLATNVQGSDSYWRKRAAALEKVVEAARGVLKTSGMHPDARFRIAELRGLASLLRLLDGAKEG